MTSIESHKGPGRRFATGTTRGDHLLGAFGFVSHATFFLAVGAGLCWIWPDAAWPVFVVNAALATLCLVVRAAQVGTTTTKESIAAIRTAWAPQGPVSKGPSK